MFVAPPGVPPPPPPPKADDAVINSCPVELLNVTTWVVAVVWLIKPCKNILAEPDCEKDPVIPNEPVI